MKCYDGNNDVNIGEHMDRDSLSTMTHHGHRKSLVLFGKLSTGRKTLQVIYTEHKVVILAAAFSWDPSLTTKMECLLQILTTPCITSTLL